MLKRFLRSNVTIMNRVSAPMLFMHIFLYLSQRMRDRVAIVS